MNATAQVVPIRALTKRCPACKETKAVTAFYACASKKDGCSSYCKPCDTRIRVERYTPRVRAYRRQWEKTKYDQSTPEWKYGRTKERFERHIWRVHKLTMDDARALLARQNGLCGNRACGKQLSLDVHGRRSITDRGMIDHCHQTGKVRGILCNHCNKAEGFFEKNKNLFLGIAEYLERSVR